MIVLMVLFASWLILRGLGALGVEPLATWHDSARWALAVMFVFTATAHFNKMKDDLVQMIPPIFPQRLAIVYVSGILELLGATGLLISRFHASRRLSDSAADWNVRRECKRSAEGRDAARKADDSSVAADSHADPVHCAALVVNAAVTSRA